MIKKTGKSQTGATPILLLLAALGLLAFLLVSNSFEFRGKLFTSLFPKPSSHAQEAPCWAIGSSCDLGCKYSTYTKIDSWSPTCAKTCQPSTTYYSNFSGSCSADGSGKCLKVEAVSSQNVCTDKNLYPYGDSTCTNTGGWCVEGVDYSKGINCSVQNVASSASECYWKDTVSKPVKALLVIYDPILSDGKKLHAEKGWQNPYTLVPKIIDSIRVSSGGYADYTVVSTSERNEWPKKMDGFRYDEKSYNDCLADSTKCHTPDEADYAQLWSDLNICSRISSLEFDDVFVYVFPYSGFDEYALKIPGDQMPYNTPTNYWFYAGRKKNIPDCNRKTVFTMGWNYERGVPEAVHSYGHRIETVLGLTVGRGYWDSCIGHNGVASDFDQFTCLNKDITSSSPVKIAGCGNVHFPPNGLTDYDYGNTSSVADACSSWNNYPFTNPTTVTEACQGWGCDQLSYLEWWMHHIPRKGGITLDRNLMNWWKYIIDFDNAVIEAKTGPISTPTPTPTPTLTPTSNPIQTVVISNIHSTTSANTAIITWTTNIPSTSRVTYGLTTSLGSSTIEDTGLVTLHSVTISGLTKQTRYYFKVFSKNSAGLETASSIQQFRIKNR